MLFGFQCFHRRQRVIQVFDKICIFRWPVLLSNWNSSIKMLVYQKNCLKMIIWKFKKTERCATGQCPSAHKPLLVSHRIQLSQRILGFHCIISVGLGEFHFFSSMLRFTDKFQLQRSPPLTNLAEWWAEERKSRIRREWDLFFHFQSYSCKLSPLKKAHIGSWGRRNGAIFVLDLEIFLKHQRSFEDEILSVKLRIIMIVLHGRFVPFKYKPIYIYHYLEI